jgi:hypothetical protein
LLFKRTTFRPHSGVNVIIYKTFNIAKNLAKI